MEKEIAIKKISTKFSIPEKEIIDLLDRKTIRKLPTTPSSMSATKPVPEKQPIPFQTKRHKNAHRAAKIRYFFTEPDYLLLLGKINKIREEIRRLGEEIGESCSESETFHDNFDYEEGTRQKKMWVDYLRELERFQENAKIIKSDGLQEHVGIGSEVWIETEDGGTIKKKIGSFITFSDNELSYASPLAQKIIGGKNKIIKLKDH